MKKTPQHYLLPENPQCPRDDDHGWNDDVDDEMPRDDRVFGFSWRLPNNVSIHWLDTETAEKEHSGSVSFLHFLCGKRRHVFQPHSLFCPFCKSRNQDTLTQWSDLCAGGPSMIMLIHKICMAFSGLGMCITVDRVISVRAAILLKCRNTHLIICLHTKWNKFFLLMWKLKPTCSTGTGQNFWCYEK